MFEIPLRTGVDLLGVPIEERVFPVMVVGTHETPRTLDAPDGGSARAEGPDASESLSVPDRGTG